MEKRTYLCCLLDLYGALLTPRQRTALEQHLYEDCSLFEIAEREGITRQGVRDALVRAEKELLEAEEKLGFFKRGESILNAVRALEFALDTTPIVPEARARMNELKELCEGYGV
ncbi:MAG TPA: sigma factor-like helix-turn-helix DNA-binding protein [Clostridia bacterium]|nr:sigma factor-like helix-turn-helix DNA-binding protein [Clostridia bacterium]